MSEASSTSELRRYFDLVCDLPPEVHAEALRKAGATESVVAEVMALLVADAATRTLARDPVAQLASALLLTTELTAGDAVGAWRLLREIGHGGMGAVYLAERADGHFQQEAAVKLIRGLADAEAMDRFARERQLLASLQHPQIARLLDGGATPGGQPYLVMEYVEGRNLYQWCSEQNIGLDGRLALIASVCRTLQYAHQRLIVHCDLKPSNILVRSDGVPVLLDFGVARALDKSTLSVESEKNTRQYVTPRYASPEQMRGESPGIAADVFALGVLLSELVTDRPTLREAANPTHTPNLALIEHPMPSRDARADLPWRNRLRGDVDAVVERACAADATARYPSALALAEDIERIGKHQPVMARAPTWTYLASRLLRRRWPLWTALALVITIATGFTWRTVLAEREALVQARTAEQVSDDGVNRPEPG